MRAPWMTYSEHTTAAECSGTDLVLWFGPNEDEYTEPVDQRKWRERRAKQVCAGCPVRTECLTEELTQPVADQHGVRGGMTAPDRRRLLLKWRKDGRIAAHRPIAERSLVTELLTSEFGEVA